MCSALSCSNDVFRFQKDIEVPGCRSKKWRMAFNVSKCSVMFVGKSRNVKLEEILYKLNNEIISTLSDFKYRGIVIDFNLKWKKHINTIISKAMRVLGLLKSTLWHARTRLMRTKLFADLFWSMLPTLGTLTLQKISML